MAAAAIAAGALKKVALELGGKNPQIVFPDCDWEAALDAAGLFMQPTVLSGVTREMSVAREEIFGPVLSVLTFATFDEAIAIANETLYGLSAAVWSRDFDTCIAAARHIKAGTIWINSFMDGYPELPFGGYRESGIGRELRPAALEDYMQTKTVQMHVGARTNWWLPG